MFAGFLRWLSLSVFFSTCAFASISTISSITYFGGSGEDAVTGVAFLSDGSIAIGGTTTSPTLAGKVGTKIADGTGFVARLDKSGMVIQWLVRLPAVRNVRVGAGDAIHVRLERSFAILASSGTGSPIQGPDLGFATVAMDVAPDGDMAILTSRNVHVFDARGVEKWKTAISRSFPLSVAIHPSTKEVWVGGDQNTHTGFEPYRSPFLFQYNAATGQRQKEIWNYPGSAVRADGMQLQSDSYVSYLKFDAEGRLWIGAGSDGGNTIFRKEPDDLKRDQDALAGSCFSSPCHGYTGPKNIGWFGRMNPAITDLERASWVIPYNSMAPGSRQDPPCGCKGANFQGGTKVNPGSFGVSSILPVPNGVIVFGGSYGRGPVTRNGWFYNTFYVGGGVGWMGVFHSDLKQIVEASMIPGSKNVIGDYREGRMVVVGKAEDLSSANINPAESDWHHSLPTTQGALQKAFGGGASDGYLVLASVAALPPLSLRNPQDGGLDGGRSGGLRIEAGHLVLGAAYTSDGDYSLLSSTGRILQQGPIPADGRIVLAAGSHPRGLKLLRLYDRRGIRQHVMVGLD